VPFTVPEDLPEHEEGGFGIDVFMAYCPICGQKLRFAIDETPVTAETPSFNGDQQPDRTRA
jgi:hypothetical protein